MPAHELNPSLVQYESKATLCRLVHTIQYVDSELALLLNGPIECEQLQELLCHPQGMHVLHQQILALLLYVLCTRGGVRKTAPQKIISAQLDFVELAL